MNSREIAYVGDVKHGCKTRPLKRGRWRGVCTCERMPVTDAKSQSVVVAWRRHVAEEARAAGVEPVFIDKLSLAAARKWKREKEQPAGGDS